MGRVASLDLQDSRKERTTTYREGLQALKLYASIIGVSESQIFQQAANYNLRIFAARRSPEISLYLKNSSYDLPQVLLVKFEGRTPKETVLTFQEGVYKSYLGKLDPTPEEKELIDFELKSKAAQFLRKRSRSWVNPIEVLKRLKEGKVTLFQPWGFTYSDRTAVNRKSREALEYDLQIQLGLRNFEVESQLLLVPADVYAGRINGYRTRTIMEYYSNLKKSLEGVAQNVVKRLRFLDIDLEPNFVIKPFSQILKESADLFKDIVEEANKVAFMDYFDAESDSDGYEAYTEALVSAKKYSLRDPERSAKEYVIARLVETKLIEKLFRPIKISLASQKKDIFDGSLPRVYPKYVKPFPWLGDKIEN